MHSQIRASFAKDLRNFLCRATTQRSCMLNASFSRCGRFVRFALRPQSHCKLLADRKLTTCKLKADTDSYGMGHVAGNQRLVCTASTVLMTFSKQAQACAAADSKLACSVLCARDMLHDLRYALHMQRMCHCYMGPTCF